MRKQKAAASLRLNTLVLDRRDKMQEREFAARFAVRQRKEREEELKKARQRVQTQASKLFI